MTLFLLLREAKNIFIFFKRDYNIQVVKEKRFRYLCVSKKTTMKPDLFEAPDYYNLDDLLTEEHKLIRDSARAWVKRDVSPIIEEAAQNATSQKDCLKSIVLLHSKDSDLPYL